MARKQSGPGRPSWSPERELQLAWRPSSLAAKKSVSHGGGSPFVQSMTEGGGYAKATYETYQGGFVTPMIFFTECGGFSMQPQRHPPCSRWESRCNLENSGHACLQQGQVCRRLGGARSSLPGELPVPQAAALTWDGMKAWEQGQ